MAPKSIFVATFTGRSAEKRPAAAPSSKTEAIRAKYAAISWLAGAAEELLALPQLHLHHLGQLGVVLQDPEMEPDEPPQLGDGVVLLGNGLAHRLHEPRHLLPEERDQDLFLGVEVQVDGARGDPRLARDVGDARVEVSLSGEDPKGGLDDLLWLLGIAHDER